MCLYSKLIKNRKYIANKKNKGVIPPLPLDKNGNIDYRVLYVPVKCGKCMECMKQKSREWQVRLTEEVRSDKKGKFVTLSFSDESIYKLEKDIKGLKGYELENEVAKLAILRFRERWRKKHKKAVKHWLVTELGENNTERIHIHGILWTDDIDDIEKKWKYGNVWVGEYVSERTVNYIVKYLHKTDKKHKEYKPLMRATKGIGKGYLKRTEKRRNKYNGSKTKETYRNRKGFELALPIYYRNYIYTEEEREKLWQEKLDEKVRYVDGVKIDISKNEKDYFAVLEEAKKKNQRLGYGNDSKNWERKRYELQRRKMLRNERNRKFLGDASRGKKS